MARTIIAVGLVCLSINSAVAQTADQATNALIAGMFREFEQTKVAVLEKFRNVLSPQERRIFDALNVSIDRNSWRVGDVYADVGIVNVSIGFLSHVGIINAAFAYEITEGTAQNRLPNTDRATEFANYYVDALLAKAIASQLGRPELEAKSYFQWTGMTPDRIAALARDANFRRNLALLNETNLAVVLGHEIGHHTLRHIPVRAPLGPREETAADAFGFKLAVKAGYVPLGSVGTYMMLDRFEKRNGAGASVTHPPSPCRWFRAASSGWAAIRDDKDLRAEYQRRGRSAEIEQLDELLRKGEKAAAEECPEAPLSLCELITNYFSSPPKTFVSERGELVSAGRWESKTTIPNATCFNRQRSRTSETSYVLRCQINRKNSETMVKNYYARAVDEISQCVKRMAGAEKWEQSPTNQSDDETETVGQSWSREDRAAKYEISIEVERDLKRARYLNWLEIQINVR